MCDRNLRQKATNYLVSLADVNGISDREDFPKERFSVIPARKCLHTYSVVYTNTDYTQASYVLDYILQNGLEVIDWPLTRIVATEYDTEQSAEYLELWAPVRG